MLRITQQQSATAAKRYYSTADYYTEGQELVGRWGGRAAEQLGLAGEVGQVAFEHLCDNLHPDTGRPLTARTRSDRTVGYDFTFSVPKSVSLLYARTRDAEILGAFREAVSETMAEIEAEMKARVRKGGRDEDRQTGNMVWAEFTHTTARPVDGVPDPQLHAHCFAFNATYDGRERQWKAGQFRGLKADAPYFQAAFRVRLAEKLQDLGFGVERKRDDFELAGVTPAVIKRFSRRTGVIEQTAAERGITDPDRKAELGAETRERKADTLAWPELQATWDDRLTADERHALDGVYCRANPPPRQAGGEGAAVDHAVTHSFTREAVVPERKLLTEALRRGVGSVTLDGVRAELARRPLVRAVRDGKVVTTSPDMLAWERRLIAAARDGRGRHRPLGNPARPCSRDWFNAGQKRAVAHVLGSRDFVTLVRGAAGTGKTTLEQEIGEALVQAGRPVAAVAQTTDAADLLRNEARLADAATVARFVRDTNAQDAVRGGVILLDEASQVGTKDMLHLFDLAKRLDARLVLVGDRRQHRSVSAGEPLRLLEQRAGLPVAEVTEILRQSGDYKRAAQALADGRTADGFAELDRLGWVREVPDAERYRVLAAAYLAATREVKANGERKTALVVSPTHAEAARITGNVRAALKAEGKLRGERVLPVWLPAHLTDAEKADATNYERGDMIRFHQNAPGHPSGSRVVLGGPASVPVGHADRFEAYRPAELRLAAGDRVRVTVNGKTKDGRHALKNGSLHTVRGFTPQGDVVLDNKWVVARDFGHLAHGYVVTSHASQGRTVDKVFIGQGSESFPATNRRSFYVPVTRGREQAVVFTDDKAALLKAAERADEPLTAVDLAGPARAAPRRPHKPFKSLAFVRRLATFGRDYDQHQTKRPAARDRGLGHARTD
ncbi:MAG: MobF family relaxase [Gemmataceae bacterium]